MNRRFLQAIVAAMATLAVGQANAGPIVVVNHSFETPLAGPAQFVGATNAAPLGWSVYNTVAPNGNRFFGVWNPATTVSFVSGAPDGNNVGVVFLNNPTGTFEAGLQQTLGATLQPFMTYTLEVEVGNFAPVPGPFNFTGFPGYRVEILAGGSVIAADNNLLAPPEGVFLTSLVSFTTGATHAQIGQSLGIRLVNLNGPGVEVNFDDVRMSETTIPTPASGAGLALGLLLVTGLRRYMAANRRRGGTSHAETIFSVAAAGGGLGGSRFG
ncbi:MAG: hypothetical protein SFV21_02505 [Rhodospirillaceae bacterium]|nr:hypothetical protein [Rhodospirillaceae bacterium]